MSIPSTLDDYTIQWLTKLPKAAKLVLWLDPYALLELANQIVDNRGKSWQILFYRGDDFRFRATLNQLEKTQPVIIWIRPPIDKVNPFLDLTYLTDLLNRHDGILDLGLESIPAELTPNKACPAELAAQGNVVVPHLGALATGAKNFQQLKETHPEADLEIVPIEKKGKNRDKLHIKAETRAQADASVFADYFSNSDYLQDLPPQAQQALVVERGATIKMFADVFNKMFAVFFGSVNTQNSGISIINNNFQNQDNTSTDDNRHINTDGGNYNENIKGDYVQGDNSGK
jgi:hypothetical protein